MKKIIVFLLITLVISGCTNLNESNIDELSNEIITSDIKYSNTYRTGYKYYLPQGLKVINEQDFNETINYLQYKLFMYVDVVSYNKKVKNLYESNLDSYYSERLDYDGKFGYIEINLLKSKKYLIEIMYNYAKIEVIVDENDIKSTVSYILTILKSVEYNDNVISNILEDDILSFTEEEYDIFSTASKESKYLYYLEEYDEYKEENETIKDSDLIN